MSENVFRFKQFTIIQERSALKVGTDAVLLGSWTSATDTQHILDIGTGTGILAIMLAQKSSAQVDAIDIDEASCAEATENVLSTPWQGRISVIHQPLQEYAKSCATRYDLIVSNPPYFDDGSGNSENARTNAKHTSTLSYSELLTGVVTLLTDKGRFCIILPGRESNAFRELAQASGLHCHKKVKVFTRAGKPEKRVLMELLRDTDTFTETELVMQDENLKNTNEYIELTKDFYPDLK